MKYIKGLYLIFILIFSFSLSACGKKGDSATVPDITEDNHGNVETPEDELAKEQKRIYMAAVKAGFSGSYEDWLDSIRGDSIELKVDNSILLYKYKKSSKWIQLISLKDLATSGKDGEDGREVELSVDKDAILWRYKGDTDWLTLISLDSLSGKAGDSAYEIAVQNGFKGTVSDWLESLKGKDGKDADIEFRVTVEAIEWHYKGQDTWNFLISLESLQGQDGETGAQGESAYDIAVKNGFQGGVNEWLESLKGKDGSSFNGIEFRVTLTHIEWRYLDGDVWYYLVGLDQIKGQDGASAYDIAVQNGFKGDIYEWIESLKGQKGEAGNDGREIELRTNVESLEWHYKGEDTWYFLMSIDRLRGETGESAYELACKFGFVGNEYEWLESLKGEAGKQIVFEVGVDAIWWYYDAPNHQLHKLIDLKDLKGEAGKSAYEIACDLGFYGSPSEWLETLKGAKGDNGRSVSLRVTTNEIEWGYADINEWHHLLFLSEITGEDGQNGQNGQDGKSAYDIACDLGFVGGVSEWLESLKGQTGQNGVDGREVEFRVTVQNIEWRYVGDPHYQVLISLASLKGKDGETGAQGESAYDIAVKNGFQGNVNEWLESLKGQAGANGQDGQNGEDGTDGREVEFRVTVDAIEWHYVGDPIWQELLKLADITGKDGEDGQDGQNGQDGADGKDGLSAYEIACAQGFVGSVSEWLESLKGQAGTNGQDGTDGREIEFKVTLEAILWRYKGEEQYQTLLSLASIKGQDGQQGAQGESAYEIAVKNGFKGTIDEWLKSLKGEAGSSGREVEFSLSETHIVWRYVGEDTYHDLVSLESLKGEAGAAGAAGKSAYEIYCEKHPDYHKTEEEWLDDLVNNRLGEKVKYTISFTTHTDLVIPSQEVVEGGKATKPENPVKEGYTFLGWFVGDEKWVFVGYPVTESLTLEARFEINTYTITVDNANGDALITLKEVYNSYLTLQEPRKNGLIFAAFYDQDGVLVDEAYQVKKDLKITARYTDQVMVTLKNPFFADLILEGRVGESIVLPNPERYQEYNFSYWGLKTENGLEYVNNEFKLENHHYVIHAVYNMEAIIQGDTYTFSIKDDNTLGLCGISLVSYSERLTLPAMVFGKKVTSLDFNLSGNLDSVTNLTLGENMTSISRSALTRFRNLKTISFGKNLVNYEENLLSMFAGLETIYIRNNVSLAYLGYKPDPNYKNQTSKRTGLHIIYNELDEGNRLSDYLFSGDTLTGRFNLYFDQGFTEVADHMVEGIGNSPRYELKDIYLAGSITRIGSYAFSKAKFNEVYLPVNLEVIADHAFMDSSFRIFNVNNKLHTIGDYAFSHTDIAYLDLPSHVKNIGKYAFSNNLRLSEAILPEDLTTIPEGLFADCNYLNTMKINDSVTTIKKRAFMNCREYQPICGLNVTTIEDYAFKDVIHVYLAHYGALPTYSPLMTNVAVTYGYNMPARSYLVGVNDNLVEVKNQVRTDFYSLSLSVNQGDKLSFKLGHLDYPATHLELLLNPILMEENNLTPEFTVKNSGTYTIYLDFINKTVFLDGFNLVNPNYEGTDDNFNYQVIDGKVIIKELHNKDLTSLNLDNYFNKYQVVEIKENAFINSKLEKVNLGSNLTTINNHAFRDSKALKEVILPGVLQNIGIAPFRGCTSLTTVSFSQYNNKFAAYEGYLEDEQTNTIIQGWGKIILAPASYYATECFADLTTLERAVIGGSTFKEIGVDAFRNCTNLNFFAFYDEISYKGNLTIKTHAFMGCSNLNEVIIPDMIDIIETEAFDTNTTVNSYLRERPETWDRNFALGKVNFNYQKPSDYFIYINNQQYNLVYQKGVSDQFIIYGLSVNTTDSFDLYKNGKKLLYKVKNTPNNILSDSKQFKIACNQVKAILKVYNENSYEIEFVKTGLGYSEVFLENYYYHDKTDVIYINYIYRNGDQEEVLLEKTEVNGQYTGFNFSRPYTLEAFTIRWYNNSHQLQHESSQYTVNDYLVYFARY